MRVDDRFVNLHRDIGRRADYQIDDQTVFIGWSILARNVIVVVAGIGVGIQSFGSVIEFSKDADFPGNKSFFQFRVGRVERKHNLFFVAVIHADNRQCHFRRFQIREFGYIIRICKNTGTEFPASKS